MRRRWNPSGFEEKLKAALQTDEAMAKFLDKLVGPTAGPMTPMKMCG
jgi:hypothetical protein